jgi:DNA-binding LacI/PurR family transcriptional regulator
MTWSPSVFCKRANWAASADDLAVVGFDDIPWLRCDLRADSCHVPRYEMGDQAMKLLLDRINPGLSGRDLGCTEDCEEIVLYPTLVVRASAP